MRNLASHYEDNILQGEENHYNFAFFAKHHQMTKSFMRTRKISGMHFR
jgi:hypothetical protein